MNCKRRIELLFEFDEVPRDMDALIANVANAIEWRINEIGITGDEERATLLNVRLETISLAMVVWQSPLYRGGGEYEHQVQ